MEKAKPIAEFQLRDMVGIGIILIVFGIAITYGLQITTSNAEELCEAGNLHVYNNSQCWSNSSAALSAHQTGPAEYNASIQVTKGIAKLPEKLPLIATIIVAVIVIGIIVRYLGNLYAAK